jgi:hypothetical protein
MCRLADRGDKGLNTPCKSLIHLLEFRKPLHVVVDKDGRRPRCCCGRQTFVVLSCALYCHQVPHDIGVAAFGRKCERSPAIVIAHVEFAAMLQQDLRSRVI